MATKKKATKSNPKDDARAALLARVKTVDTSEESQAQRQKDVGDDSRFWKIPEGKSQIRVLPPGAEVAYTDPWVIVHEHWVQLPDGNRQRIVCPERSVGGYCPVCARASELSKSGSLIDRKAAGQLWPRKRAYLNVIVRGMEDEGPKILGISKSLLSDFVHILDVSGDFTHPFDGFDLVLFRKGTTQTDTEYKLSACRDASELAEDLEEALGWVEQQEDLTLQAVVLDEPDLADLLSAWTGGGKSPDGKALPARMPARRALPSRAATAQDRLSEPVEDDEDLAY